ncbi:MAG TPA: YqaE/Pmp3 family membrane protein [Chitinophagaceae bacterium]|nr:YqaE/Pmp3 family membrane protein [Chitinophagaceae bacterium]
MRKGIFLVLSALIVCSSSFTPSYAAVLPSSTASVPASKPDPEKIRAAIKAFNALPKKERKAKIKEAKQAIKEFKKQKRKGMDPSTDTLLLVIIAIFIPPLAVYLHQGETNNKFWITTLLFVLGIIAGFIFSWLLILAAIIYALIVILGNG